MGAISAWIVVLLTALVYLRVCGFEFTNWDDDVNVWANPLLNPPSAGHMLQFWTAPYQKLYVPVIYTVWSLVAAAGWVAQPDSFGIHLNPYLFHSLNFILHLGCVLAVWRVLRELGIAAWAAVFGAAVFGLHPVQVEAVAWVTGGRDLLGTLFSLLSILVFLHATGSDESEPAVGKFVEATLLFVLAVLCKPSAVVTPFLVVLLTRWRPLPMSRSARGVMLIWCAIGAIGALATRFAQPAEQATAHAVPLWFRPVAALDALAFYAAKLLWPTRLAIDYGRTPEFLYASGQWHWTWAVPVLVVAVLFLARAERRAWICAGIFAASLLPVLGLVSFNFQTHYSTTADRYLYAAMLGPALALAWGLSSLPEDRPRLRRACLTTAAIWLAVAGMLTFRQTGYWRDGQTLFTHAIAVNPQSEAAYNNRGFYLEHDQDFAAAERDYRMAVALKPNEPQWRNNWARSLLLLGRVEEGISQWEQALSRQERDGVRPSPGTPAANDLAADYLHLAQRAQRAGLNEKAQRFFARSAYYDPRPGGAQAPK